MLLRLYNAITRSGVGPELDETLSDKIITRNRLSFFCVFFSTLYLIYFIASKLFLPSVGIAITIILFVLSIIFNHRQKIGFSAFIILIATNYSVLSTSLIFGFGSGFHLYLLTAPLIIYVLFDFKKNAYNVMAILSYCLTFLVVFLADKNYHYHFYDLSYEQSEFFYMTNFVFAIVILVILFLYFMFNNRSVNVQLLNKNKVLAHHQEVLWAEISERRNTEEKLSRSLAEKEILISEIHHRVKNNLAVISGLIEYQTMYSEEEGEKKALTEHKNRIKSIALLYEKLYSDLNHPLVRMNECISELLKYLILSLDFKSKKISLDSKIDHFDLDFEKALALSLIINELCSVSANRDPERGQYRKIDLQIKINNNKGDLFYKDGSGISLNPNSFSLELIEVLAGQLNDSGFEIDDKDQVFKIEFSLL